MIFELKYLNHVFVGWKFLYLFYTVYSINTVLVDPGNNIRCL